LVGSARARRGIEEGIFEEDWKDGRVEGKGSMGWWKGGRVGRVDERFSTREERFFEEEWRLGRWEREYGKGGMRGRKELKKDSSRESEKED
jgi:hypothetical protein